MLYNTIQYNTVQYNATQRNITQHNTVQHNSAQHNTMQYSAIYNMLSWEFKLAWGENCSKNRKIRAKVDPRTYVDGGSR